MDKNGQNGQIKQGTRIQKCLWSQFNGNMYNHCLGSCVVTCESVTAVMRPRDKCGECLVKGRIHYGVTVDISSLMSRHNMNNTLIIY